ncbi:aminoglycoside phosphotransferase family protein [Legionella nagasakiensis]|uniref:aminoglycoside phosphotransferase family protein n=1 Tax=Legionella nagasakiensis TaxID=535290 RepID=UPI001054F5BE|nr:aminoglycoside phosphotransferase family protein [Legionella nagasakiensis]
MTDEKANNILKEAIQWACKVLTSLGYTLKTDLPEKVQHTHWSYVVRFKTSEGYVYLKQTPPAIALEAKISQVLHEQFDASTPKIIASNAELNCFLMKDAGQSLREILKKKFDKELVCSAIDQFTSLQIAVSERVDVLLDVGVPDWRLENFPDLYREVISDKKLLMDDGLSEIEIDEVGALVPKIYTLCEKLSSYSIKQTIVQPDCNDNNILIDDTSKTITIIDLGELVISHPFFSLLNFLHIIKKHHALKEEDKTYVEIKSAGLKPYMMFESEENISGAFLIAQELWFVYGILAHYRLMLACGKKRIMSWQHGKLSSLFRGFMASGR